MEISTLRLSLLALLLILFAGCKSYVQLFEATSDDVNITQNQCIYKTDSIVILYDFWIENGSMSFAIINKLDAPIYVDWKNSAFIKNGIKYDYWTNEEKTQIVQVGTSSTYFNTTSPNLPNAYSLNRSTVQERTYKPERITFIPPNSGHTVMTYNLVSKYNLSSPKQKVTERNDNSKRETEIYYQNFNSSNTPLVFRNYLSISFSENSKEFFFIDNSFYISKVIEMDSRHFNGKMVRSNIEADISDDYVYDSPSEASYERPFKKPSNFYIPIESSSSNE